MHDTHACHDEEDIGGEEVALVELLQDIDLAGDVHHGDQIDDGTATTLVDEMVIGIARHGSWRELNTYP